MHNTLIIQFDIGVVLLIRKGLVFTISSIYPKIFFILYHLYWDSITSMPSEIFTTNPTQGPCLVSGTLHFLGEYLINTNIFYENCLVPLQHYISQGPYIINLNEDIIRKFLVLTHLVHPWNLQIIPLWQH